MTLVVAHQYEDPARLHLVADTRISYDMEPAGQTGRTLHQRLDRAVLKLIVSGDRRRVLGFAGPLSDRLQDVLRVAHDAATRHEAVSEAAKECAHATGAQFLIARLDPLGIERIDRLTLTSETFAWIGNPDAFDAFQRALASERGKRAEQMERALTTVLNDGAHDVGGFAVRVSQTAPAAFGYFVLSAADFGDSSIQTSGGGAATVQSRSEGAFVALGFRAAEEYPAVGWWFPQSSTGYVSAPLHDLEPRPLSAASPEDFCSAAEFFVQRSMLRGNVVRLRSEHGGN